MKKYPLIILSLFFCAGVLISVSTEARKASAYLVNSADDDPSDGICDAYHCNLREAIEAANSTHGKSRIYFALPARSLYRIFPRAALPPLNGTLLLDGTSQEGTLCPKPVVQLDGSLIDASEDVNGLEIFGDSMTVRGLIISNFSGHGVLVRGDENTLQCLFIGTDAEGYLAAGNRGNGIAVDGGVSNILGSRDRSQGNLISANGGWGIRIRDSLNTFQNNNHLGVNILGEPTLPNGEAPVEFGVDDVPPDAMYDPALIESMTQAYEAELEYLEVADAEAFAVIEEELILKYLAKSGLDDSGLAPSSLVELSRLLANDPDLYAEFAEDVDEQLKHLQQQQVRDVVFLNDFYGEYIPGLGRDSELYAEEGRDLLSETIDQYTGDDLVISGSPIDIEVAPAEEGPVELTPFFFGGLAAFGPMARSTVDAMYSNGDTWLDVLQTNFQCTSIASICTWPVGWDFFPFSVELIWKSSTLTQQQLEDIVLENGYLLHLTVNGQVLEKGPQWGGQTSLQQGYYAVTLPGGVGNCPQGYRCIATSVRGRQKLSNIPLPWTFEFKVEELVYHNPPVLKLDGNGNLKFYSYTRELFSKVSRVVLPNATNGLSWFNEALMPTFKSDRCMDCHMFGTEQALIQHHLLNNAYLGFVNLEPSAYDPGGHVMTCGDGCHVVPKTDSHGDPFHEVAWKAPYFDLDIDWYVKNAVEICGRVKANLPTQTLRHEHFHEDARLFWAIEAPYVMNQPLPPRAEPQTFDEFLFRVDLWNNLGARCP